MHTEMFYRRANVTRQDALAGLLARFPEADVVSFEKVKKDGQEVFAAELRLAEFPPKKDEGEEEPAAEEKSEAPAEDGPDDAPAEGGGDEGGDEGGDSAPPFGGGDEGAPVEGGEHHKPKATLDEVVNLLHQVLHSIAPGPDVAPGGMGADPASLMDVGAPVPGESPLPPGAEGAPGVGGVPLPPPVKHPRDQGGVPSFASTKEGMAVSKQDFNAIAQILSTNGADPSLAGQIADYFATQNERFDHDRFMDASQPQGDPTQQQPVAAWKNHRSFDTIRDDAHELTNKKLIEEAHQVFAGYRVAKIDRRQLAEKNQVIVAMVKASA